jgi:hypothetical protein
MEKSQVTLCCGKVMKVIRMLVACLNREFQNSQVRYNQLQVVRKANVIGASVMDIPQIKTTPRDLHPESC